MEDDWMSETMKKIKETKPMQVKTTDNDLSFAIDSLEACVSKLSEKACKCERDLKEKDAQVQQKLSSLQSKYQDLDIDLFKLMEGCAELETRIAHLEKRPPMFPIYGLVICLSLLAAAILIKFGAF